MIDVNNEEYDPLQGFRKIGAKLEREIDSLEEKFDAVAGLPVVRRFLAYDALLRERRRSAESLHCLVGGVVLRSELPQKTPGPKSG